MTCKDRLTHYLQEQQVPYQVHDHRAVYTAEQMAAAEHLAGKLVGKAVMAFADDKLVMLVLPATHVVDYAKAASALGTQEVRLATEDEFVAAFPDCALGALPVFGNLYDLPVYVDASLADDETITFPAGTHTESMSLRYADFERLVKPIRVAFARQRAGYTA
jgi:Ala-tRNA(Pro) deacylase